MSLSCTVNKILSLVSKKNYGSHVTHHTSLSGVHASYLIKMMHALVCINQHTQFEVRTFTDMIGH